MNKEANLLTKITIGAIHVLLFGVCILTITGFLGKFSWQMDLTSHFRVQYSVVQLLCFIFLFIAKRRTSAILALVFLIINTIQIIPWYINKPNSSIRANIQFWGTLKIVLINVNTYNTNYDKTAQYIKEINPDIVALEEINSAWANFLSPILSNFQFREMLAREDNFGIGLFSKIPLEESLIKYFGKAKVPSIIAKIHVAKQPVTILFTHPLPPASQDYFHMRNEQLENISSYRKNFEQSLIVIGDLNTTSWSYYYKRFVSRMDVRDSRKGFGISPSWPTMWPYMLIPIDHCLISPGIVTLNREIGYDIGSDHYPVYIELGVVKPMTASIIFIPPIR